MAATAAQTMWPLLPRENSNLKSIKDFNRIAAEKKMDGILCTVWDDCSPHHETVWRGLYNFALFSWNYEDIKSEEVNARYRHRFYGPALADATFEFQNNLEQALVFWEKALLDKGHRHNYPQKIDLIELPDPQKPGAWTNQYEHKIKQAHAEIERYKATRAILASAEKVAVRNQYNLTLFNQINELQIYPANLLLLMADYDIAKNARQKKAVSQRLRQQVNDFTAIRQQYEKVFSKTRFLANPVGYQLDQNGHHHLANGTNSSDWMCVFELEMNRKLNSW